MITNISRTCLIYIIALSFVCVKENAAFGYSKVKIEGLSRISEDAVLSSLELYQKEGYISEKDLSRELINLYNTGFFGDISLELEGDTLVIQVVEMPIISAIKFNGMKQFKKNDIIKELSARERSFYSKSSVISDARKIETIYKTLGILEATVEPMIEFKEGGKIIVIFNIKEGKQKKIRKIYFEGNNAFSDNDLKEVLSFKEKAFYRIFTSSTGYNIGQMLSEMEKLKRFYMERGYAAFEISKNFVKVNEKGEDVDVFLFINEGKKYSFGKAEFIDNLSAEGLFTPSEKQKVTAFKPGKKFNVAEVDNTKDKIRNILQREGFILSEVIISYEFNDAQNTVNPIFTINPTRRLYINNINFSGNLKTNDNVLRREFTLTEGDVYDTEKIRRSLQRLRNLDYFSDIQVKENQIAEDRMDLNITVVEKGTLSMEFAISYDFGHSFGLNVGLTEVNFRGRGQLLGISAEKGRYDQALQVSFTEPYLFGKDLSLSTSVGYSSQNNSYINSYKYNTNFLNNRMTYSVSEHLRHSLIYSIRRDNLKIINRAAYIITNPIIFKQEGNFLTSSIGHILFLDKRDNSIIPNFGHSIKFGQTLAGLGGNIKYIENEITMEQHFLLSKMGDSVFSLRLKASNIMGYGGVDINIKDRYNLGGNNGLRGFDFSGVGPKVKHTIALDDRTHYFAYGGKNMWLGNIEYRFPNLLPRELGFLTFAFLDFGSVFGYDFETDSTLADKIFDSKSIRASYGVGISWRSPIGIIGISYAIPFKYKEFDERRSFYLSIGGFNF